MKFYVKPSENKDAQRVEPYSIRPYESTLEHAFEIHIFVTKAQFDAIVGRDLEINLRPVQTREERLREARLHSIRQLLLVYYEASTLSDLPDEMAKLIERVDAEFAKENT